MLGGSRERKLLKQECTALHSRKHKLVAMPGTATSLEFYIHTSPYMQKRPAATIACCTKKTARTCTNVWNDAVAGTGGLAPDHEHPQDRHW